MINFCDGSGQKQLIKICHFEIRMTDYDTGKILTWGGGGGEKPNRVNSQLSQQSLNNATQGHSSGQKNV